MQGEATMFFDQKARARLFLDEWNDEQKREVESALAGIVLHEALALSPQLTKFSDWILGAAGATAALLVANSSSVVANVGAVELQIAVGCLIASVGSGVLAKYVAIQIVYMHSVVPKIHQRTDELKLHHSAQVRSLIRNARSIGHVVNPTPNFDKVAEIVLKEAPWWVRRRRRRQALESLDNPLLQHIEPIRSLTRQGYYTSSQVVFLVAGYVVALMSVLGITL